MAERFAASRLVAKSRTNVDAGFATPETDHAGLASRSIAYLIDSVVLFAVAAFFLTAAGLSLFLQTGAGDRDASDGTILLFVAIAIAAFPTWLLLNLMLSLSRAQSIGQYIVGLRVVREDGGEVGILRHLVRWLALHPLLFHPLLGALWLCYSLVGLFLLSSEVAFVMTLSIVLASVVAPLASLLFALSDPQRRGLHDLISGTKLVRIE